MALMMEVHVEENKNELSIVIWDEDDADKFMASEHSIVNLKIPLETSNKNVINKKLCGRFALQKTPSKDKNEFMNEISTFRNEEKCVSERPEKRSEDENSDIPIMKKHFSGKEKYQNSENKENFFHRSMTGSVRDFKNVDGISNYLNYVNKNSESFKGMEYKTWNCQVTSKILGTNHTDGLSSYDRSSTENDYRESVILSSTKERATDSMSNASDDDDFTLMIDDDSTEKSDEPQNVGTDLISDASQRKEPPLTFRCLSCDDIFSQKSSRRQHMIAIHDLKFTCPICGFMFSLRKQLLLHLRIHSSKKFASSDSPSLSYSCSQCNRKYRSSRALKEHTKSHAPIQSRFFWKVSEMNANSSKKTEVNSAAPNFPS